MKLLVIIFFILFGFTLTGQNKILKGKFSGNDLEKSYINIININQSKATISQLDGKFKIEAKVGDSILVSSIQYNEIEFVVKPEFFEKDVEIFLKLKVNKLEQVNLYSLGLTGNLESDAKHIKIDKSEIINFGSFDISKIYDEEVTTQSEFTFKNKAMGQNPIPASVNFREIFKLISKVFNSKKKIHHTSGLTAETTNRLSDIEFFVDILKIEEDDIVQFLDYAKANGLTNDLLAQPRELDLIEFLMRISVEFKADHGQ